MKYTKLDFIFRCKKCGFMYISDTDVECQNDECSNAGKSCEKCFVVREIDT